MKIEIQDITCGYGKKAIVRNLNAEIEAGRVLCLLGPNGAGKTTLFKSILGFLPVISGKVLINGEDSRSYSRARFAKMIAYVPQTHNAPFSFSVLDVVMMGRTAHMGMFGQPSRSDVEKAYEVLEELEVSYLADQVFTEISGGERQMVMIARALVQQPAFIMLDEPTSNLDFGNQVRVLQQVLRLAESGIGVIMTTHTPDHAFLYEGSVVLLNHDGSYLSGAVEEIITEANLSQAYGVKVHIMHGNKDGEKMQYCYPVLKRHG